MKMSEYTDKIMKIFLNNKEHGTGGVKMVEIEIFSARNTTGIAINNMRVTKTKPYGFIQPMQKYVVDEKTIIEAIGADVQPVKHGRWIGVDYDTYFECSECKHMTDWQLYKYCPYCGARMIKDGDKE
jgi:NADH pyrophosphatase NudC (nudix superfamily)